MLPEDHLEAVFLYEQPKLRNRNGRKFYFLNFQVVKAAQRRRPLQMLGSFSIESLLCR